MTPDYTQRAVVGWVSDGNRVLTVSRRNRPFDIGLPGGKVEPSETRLQALARELHEETGIEVLSASMYFERTVPGESSFDTSLFFVHKFCGEPRNCEPGISVRWALFGDLLSPDCTFRDYNANTLAWFQARGLLFNAVSVRLRNDDP